MAANTNNETFTPAERKVAPADATLRFSHLHCYTDALKSVYEYQSLAVKLNAFCESLVCKDSGFDVDAGRAQWLRLSETFACPSTGKATPEFFSPAGQDLVEQQIVGVGWRIIGSHSGAATRSVLLSSSDLNGVKFVISAHNESGIDKLQDVADVGDECDHFSMTHLKRFGGAHHGRQGIAVLGFEVATGDTAKIWAKYNELHPKLVLGQHEYPGVAKIVEFFAYYQGEKGVSEADLGTVLRFVEYATPSARQNALPGITSRAAEFPAHGQPAYCDHWVSNVISRTGFLGTLEDVLGFTPKVDFNAGVVAAGEAQIESTVTGNSPGLFFETADAALVNQSQIYLPTNNSLSEVGHVNIFLKEIGQGIQHVATRVSDLVGLIQKANDFRKMTGAGLSFLIIPRSYYGYLNKDVLVKDAAVDAAEAARLMSGLEKAGIVDESGIVKLDLSSDEIKQAVPDISESLVSVILRGRYRNLHSLLRDQVDETMYLAMVRNNILVDVQGEDLLMQIFTSKVMVRGAQEGPFLEFIQRLCSKKPGATGVKMRPGCGGFGIRNFLTLFLSIEVSKASQSRAKAVAEGRTADADCHWKEVQTFTAQLDESNPILTGISDAMTAEGLALERGDAAEAAKWAAEKAKGNELLQSCSTKYKDAMARLREDRSKSA